MKNLSRTGLMLTVVIFIFSVLFVVPTPQEASAQALNCDDAVYVRDDRPWTEFEESRALGPAAELDPGDPIKRIIAVPSPQQFIDIVGSNNVSESEFQTIVERFGNLATWYSTNPTNPGNAYTRLESAIADCGPLNGNLNDGRLCDRFDANSCVSVITAQQLADQFGDAGIDATPDLPGDNDQPADDTADAATPDDCRDTLGGAIAWAVCAGIEWVDSSINELLQTLNNLLSVNRSEVETAEMRKAWSFFRNIASLLLVVIGLIMIIGQAVSKE